MKSLEDKGYIQVYTGDGKGKTTAALGLAFRALGHGLSVYIGQFMKGIAYGEVFAADAFGDRLTIERFGEDTMVHPDHPRDEDLNRAEDGLKEIKQAVDSGKYQVVILDEINVTVAYGLVDVAKVLDIIDNKPDGVEFILTGRDAPQEFLDRADLISEVKEIRHYYTEKSVLSRKGIDR